MYTSQPGLTAPPWLQNGLSYLEEILFAILRGFPLCFTHRAHTLVPPGRPAVPFTIGVPITHTGLVKHDVIGSFGNICLYTVCGNMMQLLTAFQTKTPTVPDGKHPIALHAHIQDLKRGFCNVVRSRKLGGIKGVWREGLRGTAPPRLPAIWGILKSQELNGKCVNNICECISKCT